ncbi:hypothetical protein F5882DRAFT_446579 [Hyaloscypha sp. PMI_1271]|nr:hypothetical protein F5882DRAFT_446579 [Hyaloscypha sp. PMI_1271]
MGIGVALRVDFCSLSLVLSLLADSGSSTVTVALVSDNAAWSARRMQTFKSKPKARRISTITAGVVPGIACSKVVRWVLVTGGSGSAVRSALDGAEWIGPDFD